jgi:hypothetical protein
MNTIRPYEIRKVTPYVWEVWLGDKHLSTMLKKRDCVSWIRKRLLELAAGEGAK